MVGGAVGCDMLGMEGSNYGIGGLCVGKNESGGVKVIIVGENIL